MPNWLTSPEHERSAGLLLHITSLPGRFGIGDLGPTADAWVDALSQARQTWWQILPISPTGYGNSPYQSTSSFAGNTFLISPERLVEQGWLKRDDVPHLAFPAESVDFDAVGPFKERIIATAWESFCTRPDSAQRHAFEEFCEHQSHWLDDYALFASLKDAHQGKSWVEWEPETRLREPEALDRARRALTPQIGIRKFGQFLFFQQGRQLKEYANSRGIRLIGDVPIFVAADSVDVWANPELFLLDKRGLPAVVAGVPPDYFSQTGQLWGNPLYDWPAHRQSGYAWWLARLQAALRFVDVVRLDHFRGFEAYWEVPAEMPTAERGRWVSGPGADLFDMLARQWSPLPLIAEDLGVITPAVDELRRRFHLPGMCVLQFAFGGAQEDRFLPHNHQPNTVVYTGTHDNDTTVGWYDKLTDKEHKLLRDYAPGVDLDPAWSLLRLAWGSVASRAIAPLQDILRLGSEARMNVPGTASGNWSWRFRADSLTPDVLDRLAELTLTYQRARGV